MSPALGGPRSPRPRKKTGPKPTFTREDVIHAALNLGVAEFTLADVAKQVGVATSAVYRLFDSRDDLVHACMAHCTKTMDWDFPSSTPWDHALRQWAGRIWNVCDEYPGLDVLLFTVPGVFVHVRHSINRLIKLLMKQGFSKDDALLAFDFVGDTVISAHIGVSAITTPDREGITALERTSSMIEESDFYRPEVTYLNKAFLEQKIDLILEGIGRRRDPSCPEGSRTKLNHGGEGAYNDGE